MPRRKSGTARIDDHPGWIVGADEVGWGCMAGPLVVCAAARPPRWEEARARDSKDLTPVERAALYVDYDGLSWIKRVVIEAADLDRLGPATARRVAFRQAVTEALAEVPEDQDALVVLDGLLELGLDVPTVCVPKADANVPECALASVMAKVFRDTVMGGYDREFPGYGWAENKGYVTPDHKARLRELGPTIHHRRTYKPVADIIKELEGAEQPQCLWELLDEDDA